MKVFSSSSPTSSCIALAASLTERYHAPLPFLENLNVTAVDAEFVHQYGVLLTMCLFGACALPPTSDHVAASWIHATTGVHRIIPGTNIGFVLGGDALLLDCLFPTDASTDARLRQGCGPMQADPSNGGRLTPEKKRETQEWLTNFKEFNWPRVSSWDEIPCRLLLAPFISTQCRTWWQHNGSPTTNSSNTALRERRGKKSKDTATRDATADTSLDFKVVPCGQVEVGYLEQIVGHAICHNETSFTEVPKGTSFIYLKPHSWDSTAWPAVLELQQALSQRYPMAVIWNEVVVHKPADMGDIVQAVLWYPRDNYVDPHESFRSLKDARREAKLLAGTSQKHVPVITVKETSEGRVEFRCGDEETEDNDM